MMSLKPIILALLSIASTASADGTCDVPTNEVVRADNNRCVCAEGLTLDTPVNGTTELADGDQWAEEGCGVSADIPGIWYKMNGIGERVKVTVCTIDGIKTVYSVTTKCNTEAGCVGGPTGTTNARCEINEVSAYEFDTVSGTEYFINVRSDPTIRSNFTVMIEKVNKDGNSDSNDGSGALQPFSASAVSAVLATGAFVAGLFMV
mmetsp:Transcript_21954/g.61132  ORF Transcript_21954/g.61132 Transcript_21954/m.61132 type:complete len:205 (-) Transcript_21954:1400-2014(-)|eukprot:CAMPEP_0198133500 /NCGR_PEP_ID=MMETSP1442-20131203/59596_1 /TAXON_ID= /ORGANISM="Craspedostauros australis, Strain CCMP3328" /LENGTH=204 /DNA_ID=CAMNT_0043794621 /DNA_START=743 /DNA_END=1357 /DNA_ORIENTATION=-